MDGGGCGTRAAALQGEHEPMLTPKHLRLPACSKKEWGVGRLPGGLGASQAGSTPYSVPLSMQSTTRVRGTFTRNLAAGGTALTSLQETWNSLSLI